MDELQTNINRVAGAIAASLVVDWGKAFLVAADNMSQLNARIERLTGSSAAASQTMQSLMRISSATGGSLQDTEKLWETLSTALRDTGATNGQIIQLTETLQKIGRIGGSSAEEMANALRQFGQSISSGVVRAEEFNSIPSKCLNWLARSPPEWALASASCGNSCWTESSRQKMPSTQFRSKPVQLMQSSRNSRARFHRLIPR